MLIHRSTLSRLASSAVGGVPACSPVIPGGQQLRQAPGGLAPAGPRKLHRQWLAAAAGARARQLDAARAEVRLLHATTSGSSGSRVRGSRSPQGITAIAGWLDEYAPSNQGPAIKAQQSQSSHHCKAGAPRPHSPTRPSPSRAAAPPARAAGSSCGSGNRRSRREAGAAGPHLQAEAGVE